MRHPVAVATLSLALCAALPLSAQQKMEELAPISSQSQGPQAIGVDQDVYCVGWLGQPEDYTHATAPG